MGKSPFTVAQVPLFSQTNYTCNERVTKWIALLLPRATAHRY